MIGTPIFMVCLFAPCLARDVRAVSAFALTRNQIPAHLIEMIARRANGWMSNVSELNVNELLNWRQFQDADWGAKCGRELQCRVDACNCDERQSLTLFPSRSGRAYVFVLEQQKVVRGAPEFRFILNIEEGHGSDISDFTEMLSNVRGRRRGVALHLAKQSCMIDMDSRSIKLSPYCQKSVFKRVTIGWQNPGYMVSDIILVPVDAFHWEGMFGEKELQKTIALHATINPNRTSNFSLIVK